jgi:hypothetical protein
VCWDFGGKSGSVWNKITCPVARKVEGEEPVQEPEADSDSERIYCNIVELAQDPVYENQR